MGLLAAEGPPYLAFDSISWFILPLSLFITRPSLHLLLIWSVWILVGIIAIGVCFKTGRRISKCLIQNKKRDESAEMANLSPYLRRFVFCSAAMGLISSSLIWLLDSSDPLWLLIFFLLVLSAGLAIKLVHLSFYHPAFIGNCLASGGNVALWGFIQWDFNPQEQWYFFVMMSPIGFIIGMLIISAQYVKMINKSCATAGHINRINHDMKLVQGRTDRLNQEFMREIELGIGTRKALKLEKERAQIMLESIGDGVISTDRSGRVIYMNSVAEQLIGWAETKALGVPLNQIFKLVDETTGEELENLVQLCTKHWKAFKQAGTLLPCASLREQNHIMVEMTAAPILGADKGCSGVILILHDLTRVKGLTKHLLYQAQHDQLTGILNRSAFTSILGSAMERDLFQKQPRILLYLDIDRFGLINESAGPMAGDQALCAVAMTLNQWKPVNAIIGRLGDDEFAVFIENCSMERGQDLANELLTLIRMQPFEWEEDSFEMTLSIGLAKVPADVHDPSSLLISAESACYLAKGAGGNQVYQGIDLNLSPKSGGQSDKWISRIPRALSDHRFHLFVQAIEPISGDEPGASHAEILLRLVDEHGQGISPGQFLPSAERYHLMPRIDRWVIETVLKAMREGNAVLDSLHACSINLSGQSIGDHGFLKFVLESLELSRIDPKRIIFEITETAAIANIDHAIEFMQALCERGCRFSLDDFGTGLSSFSYLRRLPVSYLKIDGSFIRDVTKDEVAYSMVAAINQLGHALSLYTVAEFVENDAILSVLHGIGVDFAQGYGIAIPQPIDPDAYQESMDKYN